MASENRQTRVISLVEERGFLSVKELSQIFEVSEVTIRRDLQRLHDEKRLIRTYGGAVPFVGAPSPEEGVDSYSLKITSSPSENHLFEVIDVLISISLSPRSDMLLLERSEKHNVPIVAESLAIEGAETLVAVNNYQASYELGHWAGKYVREHFSGKGTLLDLTYHLRNTQERSEGFVTGLGEECKTPVDVLSLSTQANWQSAYQLTIDAMQVNPNINIIFGINDSVTYGAVKACREMEIPPQSVLVVTFGLEGNTLREELVRREYLKAGLAMFPEIVGPTCIEAGVAACSGIPLPDQLVTPHAILTAENISEFYIRSDDVWELDVEKICLPFPLPISGKDFSEDRLPEKIGFLVPFRDHEWYINLTKSMQVHAELLGIELLVTDAEQSLRDEIILRKLAIAREASELIRTGDVILIDGGQVTTYLAEALLDRQDLNITVITNSMPIFDALRAHTGIGLILTGGLLRRDSQSLTGPTAETVFRELRVDKLFLPVTGVSLEFGLSHTNLEEVTIKQAMIRAAREVILLADHTKFEQESVIQIAPVSVIDKLITDNALPASTRLDLTKQGIEVTLART